MQTHLLTMLHLSVRVMQAAMAEQVSSLILLKEQYTPPLPQRKINTYAYYYA